MRAIIVSPQNVINMVHFKCLNSIFSIYTYTQYSWSLSLFSSMYTQLQWNHSRYYDSFVYILITSSPAFTKTHFKIGKRWDMYKCQCRGEKIWKSTATQTYSVQYLVIRTASKTIRPLLKIQTEDELRLFEYFILFPLYSVTV